MRLHILQHVEFEGPGHIATWARATGHELAFTHLYRGEPLPEHRDYDGLVVMGGPMGVHDHAEFPWLAEEREFLATAMAKGRLVLGVCLGAQLIAAALGAEVRRNAHKEIGFFDIRLSPVARSTHLFRTFPASFPVLHWHGDTFGLPRHAVHLAESQGCANQGFLLGEHVLALQFHLETEAESLESMLDNCAAELEDAAGGPFVQSAEAIRQRAPAELPGLAAHCETLLQRFFVE